MSERIEKRMPNSYPSLGLRFRTPSPGPEQVLVDWFLAEGLLQPPANYRLSVFREPKLESGFPDLVLVTWDWAIAKNWNSDRMKLSKGDVRLAHFLSQEGPSTSKDLVALYGRKALDSLARLQSAEMLRQRNSLWRIAPLSQIFAVRTIVSVEAKMSGWNRALGQAHLNTWFASHSYILVPHVPRDNSLIEAATRLGVGIWTRSVGRIKKPIPAPGKLPHSYGSWLFNEWVWRASEF